MSTDGSGKREMMSVRGGLGRRNSGDLRWEMPKVCGHSGGGQDIGGTWCTIFWWDGNYIVMDVIKTDVRQRSDCGAVRLLDMIKTDI